MIGKREARPIVGAAAVLCASAVVVPYVPGLEHLLDVIATVVLAVVLLACVAMVVRDLWL